MLSKDADTYTRNDWPNVFDPAGVALGIIDADGTLKLANDGWCGDGRDRQAPKALQVKPGASWLQALRLIAQRGDESAKRVLQAFDWTLSGVVRSIRCEFFEPLPATRWFDITISMLRDGAGIIVTSIDVTARKRTMEAAAELNLPFPGSGSSAGSALRGFASAPRDRNVRENVTPSFKAETRTHGLLQRMRGLLHGAAMPHAEVDVNQLVRDVIGLIKGVALAHGVQIDHSLDSRNPKVSGDARQLGQMLIALILHAVTLTLNGNPGHRVILVTTLGTSNTVAICVKNQCPESFGVGLGMPLVRRIVEAHGGSLTAHHLGDHGFSIQITLPKLWRNSNRFRSGPALL